MELLSTKFVNSKGVKGLIYGRPGAGKTYLARTAKDIVVMSVEAGLLSLAGCDIPYYEIRSGADFEEAYNLVLNNPQFKTVYIDSLSELSEVVLAAEKKINKDGRNAYGVSNDYMFGMVKSFIKESEQNVFFSAKQERIQDDTGKILNGPSMPGKQLGPLLPYEFDLVLALRTHRDEEGNVTRIFQTFDDDFYLAKDRSGLLAPWEEPNLQNIIDKITGIQNANG